MKKPVFIYVLKCPDSGAIRYIGKSVDPVKRYKHHLWRAKRKAHYYCARWILGLLNSGKTPVLAVLSQVHSFGDWQKTERQYIASALAAGQPLTNMTAGGEGVELLTDADRERVRLARKAGFTPQVLTRKNASIKLSWDNDPARRAAASARMKILANTPERKLQSSRNGKGRSPEAEARRIAAVKAYHAKRRAEKLHLTLTGE